MMERLRSYSFKSCSSAKAVIDGGLCHFGSSDPIQQRLHVWVGSNHGASIIKLEPLD